MSKDVAPTWPSPSNWSGGVVGAYSLLNGKPNRQRRGFTLLESLMAAGILLVVVVSVTAAITAGQQHSQEGHQRIVAAMAAEELLGRVACDDYGHMSAWNAHTEQVGQMTDMKGAAMPAAFGAIGRRVWVTSSTVNLNSSIGVVVRGSTVRVAAFDKSGRNLSDISRFVPEPQS